MYDIDTALDDMRIKEVYPSDGLVNDTKVKLRQDRPKKTSKFLYNSNPANKILYSNSRNSHQAGYIPRCWCRYFSKEYFTNR